MKRLKNSLLDCFPHRRHNSLSLLDRPDSEANSPATTDTLQLVAESPSTAVGNSSSNNGASGIGSLYEEFTLKHINIQCYSGSNHAQTPFRFVDTTGRDMKHPKIITIEWVFDECITQRFLHRSLKKLCHQSVVPLSDVSIVTVDEGTPSTTFGAESTYQEHEQEMVFISEHACSLIPCLNSRIQKGKPQIIELQIPFCFHFAIDYPEDMNFSREWLNGGGNNQRVNPSHVQSMAEEKVTLEGCVVFSSQVISQIARWCEHYGEHKEFIQSDLEVSSFL